MKTGIEQLRKPKTAIEQLQTAHKKTKKIDKIVRGVCIYWVVFVSIAWITYWVKGGVPDTLIQYGLGGGAVELVITGAIEIFRDLQIKKGENYDH